jgi:methionyl-tRNA formyltransferase
MLPLFHGGAFNFHPGPPEYPGNRPSAFACYHQEHQFGVTFHRMIASVDAGEILDCERFSAKGLNTASAFALQAYQSLARLFLRNAAALANPKAVLAGNGEVWSGKKTKMSDYDAMRRVPRNISPDDLDLRLKSFLGVYTPIWIEFD